MKHIQVLPFDNGDSLVIRDLTEYGIIWSLYRQEAKSLEKFIFSSIEFKPDKIVFNESIMSISMEIYKMFLKQRGAR